jgi:hypothetical protein
MMYQLSIINRKSYKMRSIVIPALFAVSLLPVSGFAQTRPQTAAVESSAPASPAATSPGGINREQYIQRARERAGQRAGTRFDRMDANHDGVLDRDEVRAWRSQHPRHARVQPDQAPPQ